MSDNLLRIVPIDPEFVPPPEADAAAVRVLRSMLSNADSIATRRTESVEFIDPGENFEGVFCPHCAADITHAWPEWMGYMHDTQRRLTLPCCGGESILNDLTYRWPAGFARFVLEAKNPESCDWLSRKQVDELREILRYPLRQIIARV